MHGGQGDPTRGPWLADAGAKPTLEQLRIGLQISELGDGGEVVVLGGAVHAPTVRVEGRDARRKAHRIAQRAEDRAGGAAVGGQPSEPLDVCGEFLDPNGISFAVDSPGQAAKTVE